MIAKPHALVTGAAGGLGRSLCDAFAAAGYCVIATDLPQQSAPASAEHYVDADLYALATQAVAREAFAAEIDRILGDGGLHVLVNNAARQILGRFADLDQRAWEESMAVNLLAPAALTRLLLGRLVSARGNVINVGSVHAVATKPEFSCYSTSKAAIEGFTRALAVDLGKEGVRVNCVAPAAVDTPMLREGFADQPAQLQALESYHPLGRIAQPREIAQTAVFLADDKAGFTTGTTVRADGGILSRLHDPL